MFNFRHATEAVVSTILLFTWPSFSQTPNGWPFAGNDLNNSHWASAETILGNQNVGGLTVKWQFTTQNDVSATPPSRFHRRLCLLSRLVCETVQTERDDLSDGVDAQDDRLWFEFVDHVAHYAIVIRHDGDHRREYLDRKCESIRIVSPGAECKRWQLDLEHLTRSQPEFSSRPALPSFITASPT